MPAPADFLTALGMAFTGYGKDQSLRDAQQERDAVEAERKAKALSEKAKADAEVLNQQHQRYLQGFRQGTAPSQAAMPAFDQQASDLFDNAKLGLPNVPGSAYDDVVAQSPPTRFSQVDPGTYIDNAATPEAIQQKRATAADVLKQANAASERRRKIADMVGTTLPNGQVVDEKLAATMLDSPAIGGAFVKPPEQQHFQFPVGTGPNGQPVLYKGNTNTGELTPSDVGKPGAQSGKEQGYVDLMSHSLPVMQQLQGKVRPWVISGALKNPTAGNAILTSDEQRYVGALRDFLAGELHAESGARLSHEQLMFGQQRYGAALGDSPQSLQAKLQSAVHAYQDRLKNMGGAKTAPVAPGAPTVKTGNIFLDGSDD